MSFPEKGGFEDIQGEVDAKEEEFKSLISDLKDDAINNFDFSAATNGNLPVYSFVAMGETFTLDISELHNVLELIGKALFFITLFSAGFIAFRK